MRHLAAQIALGLMAGLALGGCSHTSPTDPEAMQKARSGMVDRLRAGHLVTDKRVLEAMRAVPRHRLLPQDYWGQAYSDQPTPLDSQRTLCSPLLSGLIVQNLNPLSKHHILVVQPLTGYEAALLGRLCAKVVVVGLMDNDCAPLTADLEALGAPGNVEVHACDVSQGWGPEAPYDGVLLNAESGTPSTKVCEQMKASAVCVQFDGPSAQRVVVLGMQEHELVPLRTVALQ